MARAKAISVEKLKPLGVETLAGALVEHAEADPVLRKKLRILLAGTEGSGKLANEIGKRIRTIGRSRSFVDWDKAKALVQELDHLRTTISGTLVDQNRSAAASQMWAFLGIADTVLERMGDEYGYVEEVFGEAMEGLGQILADMPDMDRVALANRVMDLCNGDGFLSTDALIRHLGEALGRDGRTEIRKAAEAELTSAPTSGGSDDWRLESRRRGVAYRLAMLADLDGDVDRYIKAIQAGNMEDTHAADVAARLIDTDRPAEALTWLKKARQPYDEDDTSHIDLQVAALEALGEQGKAQEARWRYFQKTLNATYLREYLKRLPDFEDFEAEQEALASAAKHRSAETALTFLVEWRSLDMASKLVHDRLEKLDGREYYVLRPVAEALEEKYPAAATLLYRRMIESVLDRGSSKQYPYAARDLQSCDALAPQISDYGGVETHAKFMLRMKETHGRKRGFWGILESGGL